MKNGWKKICRCRKGQMLKGIVLTLTLAFLTMGLCGCAEKHDAAEELEEFTLEGESDVGKNSSKFQNRVRKRISGWHRCRRRTAGDVICSCMWSCECSGGVRTEDRCTDLRSIGSGRWNDRRCCRRLDQSGRSFE